MKLQTNNFLICVLAFGLLTHTFSQNSDETRILFVGNSMTYRNDMPQMLMELTANENIEYISTEAIAGGTSLSDRWNTYTYCRDSVTNGNHDFVSIQEYSSTPAWNPSSYRSWALRWDSLVRENGGIPVHWLNPAASANFDQYGDIIRNITTQIGEETGSLVAPIGLAWQRVVEDLDNSSFLYEDYIHPTYEGSYLDALVIYTTITGNSPVGLPALQADSATYLQNVAWEIHQDYASGNIPTFCDTVSFSALAITDADTNDRGTGYINQTIISPQSVTHSWSNSSTSKDLTGLLSGTYTDVITMVDSGCVLNKTYNIPFIDTSSTDTPISTPIGAPISTPANLTDGLVLYLPFTGNANDASGNGLNGNVHGAVLSEDRQQNPNSAYYFGDDTYISINENDLFHVNSSGFTVSAWAKADAENSMGKVISIGESGSGGFGIRVRNNSNSATYYLYNSNGSESFVRDEDYFKAEEIWNHHAITYENGVFRSYLNGVLINEENAASHPTSGYDLLIGDGEDMFDDFIGWIDEVRMYDRALTNIEVANLSGLSGAVRATEFDAFALSDFELQTLNPLKIDYRWNVWGSVNDEESYIDVTENPIKAGSNTSDYVGRAVAFKSGIEWNDFASKREYVLRTTNGYAYDHHHVMQWKFLIPDSTIIEVDTFFLDWMIINQIHQGYEYYDGGACQNGGSIAYGGGIFNDNTKVLGSANPLEYEFRYRANPDAAKVPYTIDIGKWMTFTYEIFWTQSDTGYYRLWKDGELLSSANNVQTVADCGTDADDFLQFKVGQYNKWDDSEIDSLTVYFDDLELFIDPDATIEDICPDCFNPCSGVDITISGSVTPDTLAKGVGAIDVTINSGTAPYIYSWNSGQGSEDISDLTEDLYYITVEDKDGCYNSKGFVVDNIIVDEETDEETEEETDEEIDEETDNTLEPEISFTSTAYQGMVYTLDASNSKGADEEILSYNWNLPEGISSSSITNPIISIIPTEEAEQKVFKISLTVSNSKDTAVKNISIGVYQFRPDAQELKINSLEASNYSGSHFPENLIDNNTKTLWKSEGDDEWVIFELDNKANVTHFELCFNEADNYQSNFDIFGSTDKENWELILENNTSCGFFPNLHTFATPESKLSEYYKYFKLVGHMNSSDQWNSFSEFKAFGLYGESSSVDKDTKVSMEDIVKVYPNPAENFVYVSNANESLIQVVNILGEVIFKKYAHENITQIEYDFAPGLYIINIIKDNTLMCSKKLTVK